MPRQARRVGQQVVLASLLCLLGALPADAVRVDFILYNGTDNEICRYDAASFVHYYSLLVRSTFLGEVVCSDVDWRFYENGRLVRSYHSNSSLEIVSRGWIEAGSARIEVSVDDCGFLTSSGSKSMNITVGPLPPASISGPSDLCPGETRSYSISAVADAQSYTWTVPSGFQINGGGTQLAATGATTVSVRAPSSTSASTGSVAVRANYQNGTDYPRCGPSDDQTRSIKLLKPTLTTPSYLSGPGNLCENTSGTFSTSSVAGAGSYEWEFLRNDSVVHRRTTSGPSLFLGGYHLNGFGTFQARVRAINRCGAASGWRTGSVTVLAPSHPQCSSGGDPL
ncbi:MAG: hypothetical protein AAGC60_30360 [Acidobacteriota bacterium]